MPSHQTVGEMTLDELEAFIQEVVRRETAERRAPQTEDKDRRSLDEIFASIDHNLINLPAKAKSSLELLREDRDH